MLLSSAGLVHEPIDTRVTRPPSGVADVTSTGTGPPLDELLRRGCRVVAIESEATNSRDRFTETLLIHRD